MNRILIIGCGDIAMRAIPLLRQGHRLFALVRTPSRCANLRCMGVIPVPGDLDERGSLTRIAGLADSVLHFAPPPHQGEHDTRTRHLLAALSRGSLPKRLVYISTSGVYGDCGGARISETRRLNPQTARAQLRVDAEQQIRDWGKRTGVQTAILRVPGIYAANRLPLERLRPACPGKNRGTPAIAHDEDSYTNHIHADDLARIALAALRNGLPNRVYHASDDSEMKMGEYFDAVADAYDLPRTLRLPRAEVARSVSPALWSFMNESRRLSNQRMKQELKVRLRYPTVMDALSSSKD